MFPYIQEASMIPLSQLQDAVHIYSFTLGHNDRDVTSWITTFIKD